MALTLKSVYICTPGGKSLRLLPVFTSLQLRVRNKSNTFLISQPRHIRGTFFMFVER